MGSAGQQEGGCLGSRVEGPGPTDGCSGLVGYLGFLPTCVQEGPGDSTKHPLQASTQAAAWGDSRGHVLSLDKPGTGNLLRALGLWETQATVLTNRLSRRQRKSLRHPGLRSGSSRRRDTCLPWCSLGSRQAPDGPRKNAGVACRQVWGGMGDGAGASCSQRMGQGQEMRPEPPHLCAAAKLACARLPSAHGQASGCSTGMTASGHLSPEQDLHARPSTLKRTWKTKDGPGFSQVGEHQGRGRAQGGEWRQGTRAVGGGGRGGEGRTMKCRGQSRRGR